MWNCHYHQNQSLHNFCINQQCSLPLCAKCIHLHMHDNPSIKHHILSLEDAISMTIQQLHTCLEGIRDEQNLLEKQYTPTSILENYRQVLHKYKAQSIQKINIYYKNLQKQLQTYLQNIYDSTLGTVHKPFAQKSDYLESLQKQLTNQNTTLKTLITINHNDQISFMEKLFIALKDKKSQFKDSLPRLEPGVHGDLVLVQQRSKKQQIWRSQTSQQRIPVQIGLQANRVNRIALLEGKLDNIRMSSIRRV